MEYQANGKILKLTGGLYTVALEPGDTPLSGTTVECRARGSFRHDRMSPLVGDSVTMSYQDSSFTRDEDGHCLPSADRTGLFMTAIHPRRNSLIRPPLANIDLMLVVTAAAAPAPDVPTLDKLLCILEFNHIEPVVIVGKSELDPARAAELRSVYTNAGFEAFSISCRTGEGLDGLRERLRDLLPGKTTAVAGASGVGKSTLLNTLFPELCLTTGDISRRIERGKNTTRHTQLFPVPFGEGRPDGLIADTAGFSLIDFQRFDFFTLDDLFGTFREFAPHLGTCRYTDCTHLKEEGCTIVDAVRRGEIAPSRHAAYRELYAILKDKHAWDK